MPWEGGKGEGARRARGPGGQTPPRDPGLAPHVCSPTQEQAAALGVTFLSFMIPAGWVLSHLESYKKRPGE